MTIRQCQNLNDSELLVKMKQIEKKDIPNGGGSPGMVVAIPTERRWLVGFNFNADLNNELFEPHSEDAGYGFRQLGNTMMKIHAEEEDVWESDIIYRRLTAYIGAHDQILFHVLDRLESNGYIEYDLKI